jgi:hypothetical protein
MNILQLVGYRESSVKKHDIMAVGIRSADHATPLYLLMLELTLSRCGGRSVGIVRSRTKATELVTGNHYTSVRMCGKQFFLSQDAAMVDFIVCMN